MGNVWERFKCMCIWFGGNKQHRTLHICKVKVSTIIPLVTKFQGYLYDTTKK